MGQLSISPPNIVYNTPTLVTFTITIDSPTLNQNTVELQRVDAQGKYITTIAKLTREQGGASNGKTFSTKVMLNEPKVERQYFRVGAAFRGNKVNAYSSHVFFDVDPFKLPPDPGEAGKQTLAGIDSDNDGVRDDVQRWIGYQYSNQAERRAPLMTFARLKQSLAFGTLNDTSALVVNQEINRVRACWRFLNPSNRLIALDQLRSVIANTEVRLQRYLASEDQLSGTSFVLVTPSSAACQF